MWSSRRVRGPEGRPLNDGRSSTKTKRAKSKRIWRKWGRRVAAEGCGPHRRRGRGCKEPPRVHELLRRQRCRRGMIRLKASKRSTTSSSRRLRSRSCISCRWGRGSLRRGWICWMRGGVGGGVMKPGDIPSRMRLSLTRVPNSG